MSAVVFYYGGEISGFIVAGLTGVGVSCGPVEEAGRPRHRQVGHSWSVSVHRRRDGVVVGLLRSGAGGVSSRGNTAGSPGISYRKTRPGKTRVRPGWVLLFYEWFLYIYCIWQNTLCHFLLRTSRTWHKLNLDLIWTRSDPAPTVTSDPWRVPTFTPRLLRSPSVTDV